MSGMKEQRGRMRRGNWR